MRDTVPPEPGPCGGRTIWNKWPRRHWCKLSDEDVAFLLLSGGAVLDSWAHRVEGVLREDAWEPPFLIALKQPDGILASVCFNSKCRWVKDSTRRKAAKNKGKRKKTAS